MTGERGSYQKPCEEVVDSVEKERALTDVNKKEDKFNKTGLKLGHLKHLHVRKKVPNNKVPTGFLQWCSGVRIRGNRHKLKQERFHLSIRNHFLTVMVTKHRFPRKSVESPSLEVFENSLDLVFCNQLYVAVLERGVGPVELHRSLPTSIFL